MALPPDNAFVHMKRYKTPTANAIADLCWKMGRSGNYVLVAEDDNELRVNANALSNAMRDKGIELPQSTITRLLHGKEPKLLTIQALANFFKVGHAEIRGETPVKPPSQPQEIDRWPFEKLVPFEDFMHLETEQKQQIGETVRTLIAGYKAENSPRRPRKTVAARTG
jgi:hypothetical protein